MNSEEADGRIPFRQRPWVAVLATLVLAIAATAATASLGPYLLHELRTTIAAGETELSIWADAIHSDWHRTITITRTSAPFFFWASVLSNVAMTVFLLCLSLLAWIRLAMIATHGVDSRPAGDLRYATQWLIALGGVASFYYFAVGLGLPMLGSMVFR